MNLSSTHPKEVLFDYSKAMIMQEGMEGARARMEIAYGLLGALTNVESDRDRDKVVDALILAIEHEIEAGQVLLNHARDVLNDVF